MGGPRNAAVAVVLGLCLLVAGLPGVAQAEVWEWMAGSDMPPLPPGDKAILDEGAIRKAVETARDAESRAAIIETQQAELAEKDRQIEELKGALEVARAEDAKRDHVMALAEERYRAQNDSYERMMSVITRQNELLDKTNALMDRQNVALGKAQERIESLERRDFWKSIFGPIIGGALVFFGMGAF